MAMVTIAARGAFDADTRCEVHASTVLSIDLLKSGYIVWKLIYSCRKYSFSTIFLVVPVAYRDT